MSVIIERKKLENAKFYFLIKGNEYMILISLTHCMRTFWHASTYVGRAIFDVNNFLEIAL